MEREELLRRHSLISKAFRPAAPVDDEALFAGRANQMVRVIDAVQQPGQHAAIYGGRGVGKTSLAKVMVKILGNGPTPIAAYHYTCSATDTFSSVWASIFGDLPVAFSRPATGFSPETVTTVTTAASFLGQDGET